MNLVSLLYDRAASIPDLPAIIDGRCGSERTFDFRHLEREIHACAARLHAAGVEKGARVLVLVPMRAELYITLAALWHLGVTALFLDPSAGRHHIAQCCQRTRPDGVIGIPKARLLWWFHCPLRRIPKKFVWGRQLRLHAGAAPPPPVAETTDDHPAILTFTSGSTGQPKGAVRTHGILHAQYRALRSAIALEAGEIELATMPVIALVNLAAGITTLIPDADLSRPGFIRPGPVLDQCRRFRPDRCVASPAFLSRLAESSAEAATPLASFRKIYTGGAPVFPRTLRRLESAFPNARLTILYGSTEAEPISHIHWSEVTAADRDAIKSGAGLLVGPVAPETSLQIIDDRWGQPIPAQTEADWRAARLPPGRIGEIVVAGEHVIPGYLDGIGDEENKVRVGDTVWHRTGDAGTLDAEGRLWLLGRCAVRFELEGRPVYPFAIECAAVETFDVPLAACCAPGGRPHLVLPDTHPGPLPADFTCGPHRIASVRRLRIPLDKRHNAKVDYARLQRLL